MASELEELRKKIKEAGAKLPPDKKSSASAKPDEELRPRGAVPETEGRLGIVSPTSRARMRERVGEKGTLEGIAIEASPALIGTGIGAALGSPFLPPVGAIVGGAAGGTLGELFGQETGISPENDLALQASALPMAVGPAAGATAKLARRGATASFMSLPSVQAAAGRIARQRAAGEFESFGTQIIGSRFGVDARASDELFAAAREVGGTIPVEGLTDTMKKIGSLTRTYEKYQAFPDVRQAVKTVDAMLEGLLATGMDIGMDDLIVVHKAMNNLVTTAEGHGLKSDVAEEIFTAFNDDLTRIARSGNKGARFVQAAHKRAQLDMAVGAVERQVARFTKVMPGTEDTMVDVGGLRQWVTNVTNPKHPDYNKLVAEQLGKDLPSIKKTLETWSKYSENSNNPGGPGSIVLRGIGARTGAGIAGYVLGGPVGGVVGALAGASFPEKLTSILVSPVGRKFIGAAINFGKGTVNQQRWQFATQLAVQGMTRPVVRAQEEQELSVGP